MIHHECGAADPNAACMQDGRCSKNFPKPYAAETEWRDDRSYPTYRRRAAADGGREERHGDRLITSQWVVPYNPYLSLRYNAHVNVEICCSVQSVKYLFRYIYKGHDRQIVRADDQIHVDNEIETYQDLRSIGASEAAWRLFDIPMSHRQPNVVALPVHLGNHQLSLLPGWSGEAGRPGCQEHTPHRLALIQPGTRRRKPGPHRTPLP